ncbi:MAG: signal peptidase II [Caulobacteraceae bacterium]|nr:MAG: signal peptidase II [Caulobacteraceae bacterium]
MPAAAERPAAAAGQGPTAYSLALAVLLGDQLSKLWFLNQGLIEGESREVFGPFSLTMVWNRGVSFGLFRAEVDWVRWALTLFSLAVAIVIAFWARKVQRPLLGWAFGLIMGGAVGNMIDRIRFGAVADFLDFTDLMFPWVFNIADSAISIGVVLLLIDTFLAERKQKSR